MMNSNNVQAVGRSMRAEDSQMRTNTAAQRSAAAASRQDRGRACREASGFSRAFQSK